MNVLLLFFALPLATIIISIALQKILKSPALVAGIIFSIFLIVTFIIGNLNFLIATIIYTLISYITAVLVNLICRLLRRIERCKRENNYNCCANNGNNNELLTINSRCGNNTNGNLLTISSTCQNGKNNDLLTINTNQQNSNSCCNDSCDNNCNNNCNNSNNGVSARINVIPNNTNNGRTGCICGRYRRN